MSDSAAVVKKTVNVKIELNGSDFSYTADFSGTKKNGGKVKVKKADAEEFSWTCDQPAAILFDPGTPFESLNYTNKPLPNDPSTWDLVDEQGKKPDKVTRSGRFKYYVAVFGADGRVYIDDPEVIVDY
jgi:hypothetical protein